MSEHSSELPWENPDISPALDGMDITPPLTRIRDASGFGPARLGGDTTKSGYRRPGAARWNSAEPTVPPTSEAGDYTSDSPEPVTPAEVQSSEPADERLSQLKQQIRASGNWVRTPLDRLIEGVGQEGYERTVLMSDEVKRLEHDPDVDAKISDIKSTVGELRRDHRTTSGYEREFPSSDGTIERRHVVEHNAIDPVTGASFTERAEYLENGQPNVLGPPTFMLDGQKVIAHVDPGAEPLQEPMLHSTPEELAIAARAAANIRATYGAAEGSTGEPQDQGDSAEPAEPPRIPSAGGGDAPGSPPTPPAKPVPTPGDPEDARRANGIELHPVPETHERQQLESSDTPNETDHAPFPYSPDNPPPLNELRSKLYAVHATPVLPVSGSLKPGARDVSPDQEWQGDPPSFRPTLHFSLGGLMPPHQLNSHEDTPYAVVSPLSSMEGQLVNLNTHDTFILGDFALADQDVALIVPEGTDTSLLPEGVRIHTYSADQTLRGVVRDYIQSQDGWDVRTNRGDVELGSPAYIDDQQINDPGFFGPLLERRLDISFGGHTHSITGDAYRYGLTDMSLNNAMSYYKNGYNAPSVAMERALVVDSLEKLERSLEASPIDPAARQSFYAKKAEALGWVNVIDCDLNIVSDFGKTLAYAPPHITAQVRALRNDPEQLRTYVLGNLSELHDVPPLEPLYEARFADQLSGMPPQEMLQFADNNRELFRYVDMPAVNALYAVKRMVLHPAEVEREGLHEQLSDALRAHRDPAAEELRRDVMNAVEPYLKQSSTFLPQALNTLNDPKLRRYLGIAEPSRPIADLPDLLIRHPATAPLFKEQAASSPEEQAQRDFLSSIGWYKPREVQPANQYKSFLSAEVAADGMKSSEASFRKHAADMQRPMAELRTAESVNWTLNIGQVLERDYPDATELWAKVGLGDAFRAHFPNDEAFWNSNQSLFDIYKRLRATVEKLDQE